jgi:hypothetical protein
MACGVSERLLFLEPHIFNMTGSTEVKAEICHGNGPY